MKRCAWFGLLLGALLPGLSQALDPPKPESRAKSAAGKPAAPRQLSWDDLLPESERLGPPMPSQRIQPLFDDETGPAALQEGSAQVNSELDGLTIKLPGFVVPIRFTRLSEDSDAGVVSEFLLVPYFGACIHMPPPPPNQIVDVKMMPPVKMQSMYEPVWVTGKLSTRGMSSELAAAAYSIVGAKIENYEDR
jgi:uncharacterized protein